MSSPRRKTVKIVYNGVDARSEISKYLEKFTYEDSVDKSDTISLSVADRDLKWREAWMPEKGDTILPSIIYENWNYEGEKITVICGSFMVDDFEFSAPPFRGSINGVSTPANTDFKETENSKTWEAATVQLIAGEIAGKYGMSLVYEAGDIQVAKTEQDKQTDSKFLKGICDKYGLGIKVFYNRLVIWDYRQYFAKPVVATITQDMVSRHAYKSTMRGTYTGAKVSYTNPKTKKTIEIMVGQEGRLYKSNQKADNEADARLIGENAILMANRKETTMQLTLKTRIAVSATQTVQLSGFGKADGKYFVEEVSYSITKKDGNMQMRLSRIADAAAQETGKDAGTDTEAAQGRTYTIKKYDTLWDIARGRYQDGSKSAEIYAANKEAIEEAARRHGKKDSGNGYWIFEGTTLVFP
ncbi:LysM peptidoglycan-binding domain-containing protein [Enterocloster clostridioformis]|uniref:LysM peptidoglycan-binding domain-containing protein n=1 Tax=Enterocloster clostridioformis TaxID=1531 RepID=UPI001F2CDCED|nr:LysM peptidoglycan-binding domain-containing protein [Enterocloster clostridioformis]MCF2704209.1 LysM peptidoglycan-binding domain-containing protein [Enterocloster clostridioformis]